MLQRRQQVIVDRLLRQAALRALTVVLLEALLLFTAVGQLAETVRQLDALEVHLKTLRHAVVLGADLRQRRLAGREVVNERRLFTADMRLHAHGEQQLQQRIAIFFGIGDVAQVEFGRRFAQLRLLRRQRIDVQMAQEGLLIRQGLRALAVQHLLQQIVHFVHQAVHVVVRTVPLQHGEFRVVMSPGFFIAEATPHLVDRAAARRQQALHVIFRAGHHV